MFDLALEKTKAKEYYSLMTKNLLKSVDNLMEHKKKIFKQEYVVVGLNTHTHIYI